MFYNVLNQFQLRLEEKVRENAGLTRQLENALTDLRRQSENVRDKQGQKVMYCSLLNCCLIFV